jgi:hypothetical protein
MPMLLALFLTFLNLIASLGVKYMKGISIWFGPFYPGLEVVAGPVWACPPTAMGVPFGEML